ncbi:MAG TPA: AEC family transporter [Nocardioidaceae bacterium]|nr:AEC family transporter [Nocardioidaceae bacterium]
MAGVQGVLEGFATIGLVIALGWLLAHLKVLDATAQLALARLAFFVASPCLLVTVIAEADVEHVLSRTLAATVAGVALAALPYVVVARWAWRRRADDVVIGAMCSAYCNAGNLGLPIAAYVLGDASLIAPMLLMQLVVLQPFALALLDAGRTGRFSVWRAVRTPLTNPLTIGTFLGVLLALTGWTLPAVVDDPIRLVGGMAVPGVLVAYGISLRLGPLPGRGVAAGELVLVTVLKLVVQPVGAYVAGRALGLEGPALLALAVTAALPSAQNIFVHATRYGRQSILARDAIFVTTILSVPAIVVVTALLA